MSVRVVSRRAGGTKANGGERVIDISRTSILGNPFFMQDESHRAEVIEKYRMWLRNEYKKKGQIYDRIHFLAEASLKHDLALECWCAPCACHGDVIVEAINGILKKDKS